MRAHDDLGFVLAGAADYRVAVTHLEAALEAATALGDAEGEVSALSRLSIRPREPTGLRGGARVRGERAAPVERGPPERAPRQAMAMDALEAGRPADRRLCETLERLAAAARP